MITIDGIEYNEEDLTPSTKVQISRVQELQGEVGTLEMRTAELRVLIDTYVNAIRANIKAVEDARADVEADAQEDVA